MHFAQQAARYERRHCDEADCWNWLLADEESVRPQGIFIRRNNVIVIRSRRGIHVRPWCDAAAGAMPSPGPGLRNFGFPMTSNLVPGVVDPKQT